MLDLWVFHFTTPYSLCRNHTICDGFDLIQEVPLSPSTQGVWVYWHGVDTWTVSFSTPIFLAPQPQAGVLTLIEQVPLPVRPQGASGFACRIPSSCYIPNHTFYIFYPWLLVTAQGIRGCKNVTVHVPTVRYTVPAELKITSSLSRLAHSYILSDNLEYL